MKRTTLLRLEFFEFPHHSTVKLFVTVIDDKHAFSNPKIEVRSRDEKSNATILGYTIVEFDYN